MIKALYKKFFLIVLFIPLIVLSYSKMEAYFRYEEEKQVVMILAKDIKSYMDTSFQQRGGYPLNLRELTYIPVRGIDIAYKGNREEYFVVISSPRYGLMVSKEGTYEIDLSHTQEVDLK